MASLVSGGVSGVTDKLGGLGNTALSKGQTMLDAIFPPEKRAELLAKAKAFILKNPKVSAFLMTNIALTGGPLILFVLFSITVFVFALIVALVVGLLVAVGFTLFAVGVALLILFPVVFFTTLAATFLFLWALGGYYILKWFNKDQGDTPRGEALGDKLNGLAGGKLGFLTDSARDAQHDGYKSADQEGREAGDKERQSQANRKQMEKNADENVKAQSNGTPKKPAHTNGNGPAKLPSSNASTNGAKKTADGVKKNVNTNAASGATDQVTKTANVDGVQSKVSGSTGTVKGTAGGATGLA